MPEHEAEHEQTPGGESAPAAAQPEVETQPEPTSALPATDESHPVAPPTPPTEPHHESHSHPRSLKRRLEQQAQERKTRVRSQPLNAAPPRRVREPVVLDWEPEPMTGPWRAKPFVVGLAIVAWIVALGLLMSVPAQIERVTGLLRLLVPLIWATAAAITFVPIQLRLALPGVGWQGIVGFGLLGYILAFVPAPSGWLLDLPDLPVYLLLFLAIFYAVSAAIVPLTYLLGQRYYKLRIHRLDVGRARRQAYEVGLLIVVALVMAGLRVLSPITFGLLALVIVLTEALLLSQVQPEG
ncbi:MAG TPA: hypothetical protein VFZ66_11050 [Herpetosiphonaceae bacterium]